MSHHFKIGDWVERHCPGEMGHKSIGQVLEDCGQTYWVRIIEGRNRMQGWDRDAWSKAWCIPYLTREPDWEI